MDPDSLDEPDHQQVDEPVVEVDLDAMAADLDAVDHALRRLDDGTYGTCEVCRGPIADEVLAGDPVARRCAAHDGLAPAPAPAPAPTPAPVDAR